MNWIFWKLIFCVKSLIKYNKRFNTKDKYSNEI
jgi:hypothetical protein